MATEKTQPETIEWTTVSEEPEDLTKVSFDVVGDTFQAQYIGEKTMSNDDGSYKQYRFTDADGSLYFINASYHLREAFQRVRKTNLTRIALRGKKDTGRDSAMGIYQVDVARLPIDAEIPGPVVSRPGMLTIPSDSYEPPF